MPIPTIRQARALARDLIREHGLDRAFPIDAGRLCAAHGVELRKADFSDIGSRAGREIAAVVMRADGKRRIVLDKFDPPDEARYEAARQLGRLLLDVPDAAERVRASFRRAAWLEDPILDAFAQELAMPEAPLREAYAGMAIPAAKTIARKFGVPERAAEARLDMLELEHI